MDEETMPEILEPQDVNIIYQQDKAVIDMQIATAKAYPRNIKRATDNAMAIVTMDKDTAATCTYALPRGGKTISGPSVHLAKIIAQMWGNLRIEAKVVDIGEKHITSQAVAFDLESNVAIRMEVKRSITDKFGKRYKDDMITVTGNAANSIALRNAVFAVIPRSVLDKVWTSAKRTVVGDLSSEEKLNASRKKVFDEFKDTYGVNEAEVLAVIGKPAVSNVNGDDLVVLLGIRQALIDGDTTVELTFRPKKEEVKLEDLKKLFEEKRSLMSEKEVEDAERIINGEEKVSYTKLNNLLNSKK